jgi:hypothetical protein
MEIENLGGITKRSVDLFFRPDIECAFCCLTVAGIADPGYNRAVGIFGGEESAFLRCHVADDVIENVARDRFVLSISRDLECVEIGDGELRLIVKHLFEMRHVPVAIDRVTMEPTADMIVHSACGHFAQREQSHLQRVFAGFTLGSARVESRQEVERRRSRKLRGISKTAFLRVVTTVKLPVSSI